LVKAYLASSSDFLVAAAFAPLLVLSPTSIAYCVNQIYKISTNKKALPIAR
jgi:hypothetical protein